MMSRDLLEAFAYHNEQDPGHNPWSSAYTPAGTTQDAEDIGDDFGEFETPQESRVAAAARINPAQTLVEEKTQVFDEPTHNAPTLPTLRSAHSEHEDTDWGDFIDYPDERAPKINTFQSNQSSKPWDSSSQTRIDPSEPSMTSQLQAEKGSRPLESKTKAPSAGTLQESAGAAPPPTNVPPPSVLLFLIAKLFHTLPCEIKDLVASARSGPPSHGTIANSKIAEVSFRLDLLKAAARIAAGRKLRWKRDNHLAQSMKIGQANKLGGMKLTGVDRMESRREDQEAAEAVTVWKQEAGSLRTAIRAANSTMAALAMASLNAPDIAENMPIRVGKASESARTAPKCCFLCGLKREERIDKVDINVFDNFGEWWTEHWGHNDCKAFWLAYENALRERK